MHKIISPTKLLDFIYSLMPTADSNLTVEAAEERTKILERVVNAVKMGEVHDEVEDTAPVPPAPAGDANLSAGEQLMPDEDEATPEAIGV